MSEEQTATEDSIDAVVAARRGRPAKVREDALVAATLPSSIMFPVKLIRNYRPINPFTIGGENPTEEQAAKMKAGSCIEVDKEEALSMMAKGVAVRNDPI